MIGRQMYNLHGNMLPDQPTPMEVPLRWIEPHKRARIKFGLYEKNEVALTRRFCDSSMDTIELGSGIGVVSSAICRILDPGCRFIGVEGNPELAEVAARNIARFPAKVDRTVIHAVVSGVFCEGSTRTFKMIPGNFHHSSLSTQAAETISVDVPEISLSEILKRHGYTKYQLVSDVEGAELEILQHDPSSLDNCQQIIAELHDCTTPDGNNVSIEDIAKMIEDLGFVRLARQQQVYAFRRP